MMVALKKYVLCFVMSVATFFWGIGIGKYEWFPHDFLRYLKSYHANKSSGEHDDLRRLIKRSSKIQIQCPKQSNRTGVLLAFGQSNSANDSEYLYQRSELSNVYNYFNGKCYYAESPLLGASGKRGEWISKTARNLIDMGIYDEVIVVSTGIGSSPIVRWAEGNDLNFLLKNVIVELKENYTLTDIIWHQGESDAAYTHTQTYIDLFRTINDTFKRLGINAPIFLSIASICGGRTDYPNRVTIAQKELTKEDGIYLGVNTDKLVTLNMRYDGCHFKKEGQEITANSLARIIANYHKRHE